MLRTRGPVASVRDDHTLPGDQRRAALLIESHDGRERASAVQRGGDGLHQRARAGTFAEGFFQGEHGDVWKMCGEGGGFGAVDEGAVDGADGAMWLRRPRRRLFPRRLASWSCGEGAAETVCDGGAAATYGSVTFTRPKYRPALTGVEPRQTSVSVPLP